MLPHVIGVFHPVLQLPMFWLLVVAVVLVITAVVVALVVAFSMKQLLQSPEIYR
jgi:hypothetical protein